MTRKANMAGALIPPRSQPASEHHRTGTKGQEPVDFRFDVGMLLVNEVFFVCAHISDAIHICCGFFTILDWNWLGHIVFWLRPRSAGAGAVVLEITSRNQGSELSSATMTPQCLW